MPLRPLPDYEQCEYSVFVSFNSVDNRGFSNGLVTALNDALRERMGLLDANTPRKQTHFFLDNGPAMGQLGFELPERVAKSFALLLVVGPRFAQSQWCERELEAFIAMYGESGLRSRLMIAVLSPAALNEVSRGKLWEQHIGPGQLWVPFFEAGSNDPLEPRRDDGSFTGRFFERAIQLGDALNAAIRANVAAPRSRSLPSMVAAAAVAAGDASGVRAEPTPWSPHEGTRMRIGIGPHTADVAAAAKRLVALLARDDTEIVTLDDALINTFDPDDPAAELPSVLASLDLLVVPLSYATPLSPREAGGHVGILDALWKRQSKARSIVWFRPDDGTPKPQPIGAMKKHEAVLDGVAPVCLTDQALVSLVFGDAAAGGIRLFVEKEHRAPEFFRIRRTLQRLWDGLPSPPGATKPTLSCELLDLEAFQKDPGSILRDAAGAADAGQTVLDGEVAVLLLLPWRKKPIDSLYAQIDMITKLMREKCSADVNGMVAVIRDPPPPDDDVKVQRWSSATFLKAGADGRELSFDDESREWLTGFLDDLLERYRHSLPAAG